MAAYGNMEETIVGLAQGTQNEVVSRIAAQKVDFGDAVFVNPSDPDYTGDGTKDEGTLSFDADFEASNSTVVTVNGTALAAVVYATSHAATFAAVVAAIAAVEGMVVISSNATTRTIRMRTLGKALTVSAATTGGTDQPTATFANATLELLGVAMSTQKLPAYYAAGDAVNIMRSGLISVPVASAVATNAQAYLTSANVWTDVSSGNTATNHRFRKGTTGAGLALLEVIKKGAI